MLKQWLLDVAQMTSGHAGHDNYIGTYYVGDV